MRDRVERARNQVAALVGRPREQIVFTSGGTEANWLGVMALAAAAEAEGHPRVVATTAIEHPSLRGPIEALRGRGWEVRMLPVGREDAEHVGGIGLFVVSAVNHEIGYTPQLLSLLFGLSVRVHVDAVQAVGKLSAPFLGDSFAVSAHKLGGPQGVGALVIETDGALPLVDGGHQERGRRPGTENTLGIIGFGAAAAAVDPTRWSHVKSLGDMLEDGIRRIPKTRIHGDALERVGGTINAGFAGALGESLVMALDLEGISVSTGSACTSGSVQPSAVLLGLGYPPEQAREAVRFSLGPTTTEDEIKQVLAVLPGLVERARRHR
jgi:cysteine desulfurase